MSRSYIKYLQALGFSEEQAEHLAEGQEVEGLTDKEFLRFASAWENDRVDLMKPLVNKYGWEELFERVDASTYDDKR